jgi:CheY-like chemotaxis protein
MMPTILVVDDEMPIRELISHLLADAGYRVSSAPNGRQALQLAERERLDLVLTDLMMPQVDGAELCRRLKAQAPTRNVPVVVMSAVHRRQGQEMLADEFVGKPFDLDELLALVERFAGPPDGPDADTAALPAL